MCGGGRPTSDDGPVLKFRNYQPHSEKLQEEVTKVAKPVVPVVEEQECPNSNSRRTSCATNAD